jgi:hypothetical protein
MNGAGWSTPIASLKGTMTTLWLNYGLNNTAANCRSANPTQTSIDSGGSTGGWTGVGKEYTQAVLNSIQMKFVGNGSTIQASFTGAPAVTFTDKNPEDTTYEFLAAGSFCPGKASITLTNTNLIGSAALAANVQIPRSDAVNQLGCAEYPITGKQVQNPLDATNNQRVGSNIFTWQLDTIQFIVGGSALKVLPGSDEKSYVLANDACSGGWRIDLAAAGANRGTMKEFGSNNCNQKQSRAVGILGTKGVAVQACDSGDPGCTCASDSGTTTCTLDTTATDVDNNCEKDNNTGLEWLFCGILRSVDNMVGSLNNIIENQLDFNTDENLTPEVKKAWDTIKVLATIVLVIIMLVMVISQAVSSGSGPFDAYTIRKILPRLIIAVIAVQLSWDLFIWVINIVNDLGRDIASIMYGPFGGASAMGLDAQISRMGALVGNGTTFVLFAGLTTGILAAVINPFGALLLGFAVLMAVFVGLAVLLFRKILIIMCMIFVPLALIAWILPGTQKYWKLWWETFSKLLMMFPLIIGLIAAGRIFAYVSGSSAGTVGLLDVLAVLIGFFGPYFILPKTFAWGGKAIGLMASGINNNGAFKSFSEKSKAGIGGARDRYQGKSGKAYDPNATKFQRARRRFQSGSFLPTERSRRLTTAKGDKWASERNDEATSLAGRTYEKALAGYEMYDVDEDGNYVNYDRNALGELLDSTGAVTKDKNEARVLYRGKDKGQAKTRTVTGVEAGKQALVDMVGQGHEGASDAQKRLAQAATKQLIDTHSEIEMQSARISGGPNQGKRVSETAIYSDTLTNSPQHYSAALRSRPDMAPDVIQSAEGNVSKAMGAPVTYETSTPAQRAELDKQRLGITIERMTAENLQSAHYGLFNDIKKYGDQEVEITGIDGTKSKKMLSVHLAERLKHISDSPGPAGASAVGSLSGGKEVHVNGALEAAGIKLADIK